MDYCNRLICTMDIGTLGYNRNKIYLTYFYGMPKRGMPIQVVEPEFETFWGGPPTMADLAEKVFCTTFKVSNPYCARVIHSHSWMIYGPSRRYDYLMGRPSRSSEQVLCVGFDVNHAVLHVYEEFRQIAYIGKCVHGQVQFDYNDPIFPEPLIRKAYKIIEHHNVLCENAEEDYREFRNELRRKGKIEPDLEDIPDDHLDYQSKREHYFA